MRSSSDVVVLDYGMGNLRSVVRALQAVGATPKVSDAPEDIRNAERLVFPGQGAFGQCMARLRDAGLDDAIRDFWDHERPYLGICLGLQVLFERSEEHGPVDGFGVFPGDVVRFPRGQGAVKVPHMGWNQVQFTREHPLAQVDVQPWYYFVHSYYVRPSEPSAVLATSDHGQSFTVAVARDNLAGVQFHPEKSHAAGLAMLERFMVL